MKVDPLKFKQALLLGYTIHHFNLANRAIKNRGCSYGPVGNSLGCAIGQHLPLPLAEKLDRNEYTSISQLIKIEEYKKEIPKWMDAIGGKFLDDIQELHDTHEHWNDLGLTPLGRKRVHKIATKYNLK